MKKESIKYKKGGINFTISNKNEKWWIDYYRPEVGEWKGKSAKERRKRGSTKQNATKEGLEYVKKTTIPLIVEHFFFKNSFDEIKPQHEWTLDTWSEHYFESQLGKNKPQTISNKKKHYQKHISPVLGRRPIKELTFLNLQQWQTSMLQKKVPRTNKLYKIQTVTTVRIVFFGILEHAVKAEIIQKNYFSSIDSPKTFRNLEAEQKADEINPFTTDEMNLILENTTGYLKNFILLMRYTGIRPGEIIALEWDDIDFERRVIKITKTRNKRKESEPKTVSSTREVDMLSLVKEALEAQLELTKGKEKVFMSMFHKPFYSHDIIAKLFKELLVKLKIPTRPLYNLRHTFASQAITKGVNILWTSRMLGHKDVSITLQVYAKFIIEDDIIRLKNIEELDKIL